MASRQLKFREAIPALKARRYVDYAPIDGVIKQILINWPDGCEELVDVAVGVKNTWLVPSTERTYLALNNVSPSFYAEEQVEKGEEVWLVVDNGDEANAHTITVVVTIVG